MRAAPSGKKNRMLTHGGSAADYGWSKALSDPLEDL
jgi:hypothetical protein